MLLLWYRALLFPSDLQHFSMQSPGAAVVPYCNSVVHTHNFRWPHSGSPGLAANSTVYLRTSLNFWSSFLHSLSALRQARDTVPCVAGDQPGTLWLLGRHSTTESRCLRCSCPTPPPSHAGTDVGLNLTLASAGCVAFVKFTLLSLSLRLFSPRRSRNAYPTCCDEVQTRPLTLPCLA